jgi:4-hydroxymandelate oxidase
LWQHLHLHSDVGLNAALADEAASAGFEALMIGVDAPVQGARDQQRAAGLRMPPGAIADQRYQPSKPTTRAGLCAGWADQAATWSTLEHLVARTRLPVLVKGISYPADARTAEQLGCQGVIVSNHGGRTLDTLPATAELLPEIVAAVSPRVPVLVDGGIRRGTDVLKALALGASAVLVGRLLMYGLASDGAAGAARVIRLPRDELEMAMFLSGCRQVSDADRSLLQRRPTRSYVLKTACATEHTHVDAHHAAVCLRK